MAAFDSTLIARVATGLYNTQIGNATMDWALEAINGDRYDSVADLANDLYSRDFGAMANADVAAIIVNNVDITGAADKALAIAAVKDALDATAADAKGALVLEVLNQYANLTAPQFAGYVAAFNAQVSAAVAWAQTPGSMDMPLDQPQSMANKVFVLTPVEAAGADVMRLTGDQDVRIDFTNPANQITGLDLDGDGVIEFDGKERSITGKAAGFEIVDAYSRNPLNHTDTANNFLGDIYFDGTGFKGDGVETNGNIFLGGLGMDRAFAGIGNDFLAGGGVGQSANVTAQQILAFLTPLIGAAVANTLSGFLPGGVDYLSGGRNADFFFAELSALNSVDGSGTIIDGGITADDTSAGNAQSSQDSDWLLVEGSDDDEPVTIWMNNDNPDGTFTDTDATQAGPNASTIPDDGVDDGMGRVLTRSGQNTFIDDIEHIDASGNLYGFLDDIDVRIGGLATDDPARDVAGTAANYGIGSSAQLIVYGSNADNIIVAGYDNDFVWGGDGSDLLMGGNLNHLRNPNLVGIWNDGRDELIGGNGNDNIVFETDGGIYEGGTDYAADDSFDDALWLTANSFGTRNAATVTADGVTRIDLGVGKLGGLDNFAGYGGADESAATGDYTSDQTNYADGYARAQVQDFESVIATGLGGIDYLAAGANDPELLFANQQNFLGFMGAVDLRGTDGPNTLYASSGNYVDVLEGRGGDDNLFGGDGNDDFIFGTANAGSVIGDGVDVIHRQTDADGDNIWDTDADGVGLFERDFNIGGSATTGASSLKVDLGTTDLASPDVALTSFSIKIAGVTFAVTDAAALIAATSASQVAALVNTAFQALDARVSASASGNVITVTDTGGRDISDTVAEGYAVGGVVSNGAFSAQATFNPAGTSTTQDRLIYKSYEDRADNEGVDDDSVLGSNISLGVDAYAEDLVINFQDEDGDGAATTRIAEDQQYALTFTNLTTQDKVTITVNGVNYELTVGVDLDGNIIAAEDGVGDAQAAIQTAFLTRLTAFINSYMDDDTSAGEVAAALAGNTIFLTQADYNGEETVFMRAPTVALTNPSGGEPASVTIANVSQHEVELLDFDGRNGELNAKNVLFIGETGTSRAILTTVKNAGETITGSEALVVDVGANNLQDVVWGTTTAIPNNIASNSPLSTVPNGVALHGDDFLLGGNGIDTINAGTGDDRVEGSTGADVLDGGKNFYAVQVLGEPQARVYVLNKWEAANPTKVTALNSLTISSIQLINQSESGVGTISGVFDDTLQFSQSLFTAGTTRFTVTLNDFALAGGVVELRNDGAGTVGVDVDGDGTIDHTSKFTNFENIRTVSGTGNAVANSGQGNDTLDVQALSAVTTGAGGISYNLTNGGGAGEVRYSKDAISTSATDFPVSGDYEELVLRVDGVESVIASTGADYLAIDETEAAKNNTFTAGLGVDRIEYQNVFLGEATDGAAEPTVTIKLDTVAASLGGVDTVTMTSGRVGSTVAVDTLGGVEFIQLSGNTAEGTSENDVLDITAFATGATVSYINGNVTVGGTTHVTIQGLEDVERVLGGAGNDTVLVADSATMSNNARNDQTDGTADQNILFMTYLDFDQLNTGATTRKSFAAQVLAGEITLVNNQGQFTYLLGEAATGADVDRVDYSAENGRIVVAVGQETAVTPQYVVVDGDAFDVGAPAGLVAGADRVDALRDVEQIVAAKGESVLDFTAIGQARQITFQYAAPSPNPVDKAVIEQVIRIADGSGNSLTGLNAFVEKYTYDSPTSTLAAVADATWNRVEGSDAPEVIIYQGSEDLVNQAGLDHRFTNDTLTLRGGANEVRYSPLETSISLTIVFTEEDLTTTGVAEGRIGGTVTFQDGNGAALAGGGTHVISSFGADNSTATGTLKIEASQDAEDSVRFDSVSDKTIILGTSPGVIDVRSSNTPNVNSMTLTGFELMLDGSTDDLYDVRSLATTAGLTLVDNAANDHDALKVANDSVNAGVISLLTLNGPSPGFSFDFDVLDVSAVTATGLTVIGSTGSTDEVVLGALSRVTNVQGFESMVLTDASVVAGNVFTFNPASNTLIQGSTTVVTSADILSFGGLVLEQDGWGESYLKNVAAGVTVNVVGAAGGQVHGGAGADNLTGSAAGDVFRGNLGNDVLDGGLGIEVRTIQINPTGSTAAGAVTLNLDGFILTLNVGGAADIDPDAGDNLSIAAGGGSHSIGNALAILASANLDEVNATAAFGGTDLLAVSYNESNGLLSFTFAPGVDVAATDTISLSGAGLGTVTVTGETVVTNGGNGGADTYVFEASAADNGVDTINNYDIADTLAVSDFLKAAVVKAGAVASGTMGLDLTGAANFGVVYGKATLVAADIAVAAAAGKIAIEDNGRAVVLVTADANGEADSINQAYDVYFIRDTNSSTTAQSWQVAKVATLNSPAELNATAVLTGAPVAPPPPPPPVGTVVTLAAGTSAPVVAAAVDEIFSLDVDAAKLLTANTQIDLSAFSTANDALRINLPTASGVTTLAALDGQQGIAVQFDPFSGSTLINFGQDADGDVLSLTLVGVADAALVEVDVV